MAVTPGGAMHPNLGGFTKSKIVSDIQKLMQIQKQMRNELQ